MSNYLDIIINKIQVKNPEHAAKVSKHLSEFGDEVILKAEFFYQKYSDYLVKENKTLDFGVECYLKMMDAMVKERMKFIRTKKYSSSSFDEVEQRVYANPDVMTYHMHGLVLAQFLWVDQVHRFKFFSQNITKYAQQAKNYLEIGGGHGLYLNEAIASLPQIQQFDLVDISASSLALAKGIIANNNINYYHKNIFDFTEKDSSYDFITIGEVIEHLEDPLAILKKIAKLLSKQGICYITAPINAPMIDHIYLFSNETEIRELFAMAGLEIIEEKIAITDNHTADYAQKYKIPIMYAAFVKPLNVSANH